MAKKSPLQQGFWINGRDVSGDVGAFDNIGSPRAVREITGIDKAAIEREQLRSDAAISYSGYFNDAANKLFDALKDAPTGDQIGLIAFGGNAVGDVAAMMVGKQVTHAQTKDADGGVNVTSELQGNGVTLEWGDMLTALTDTFSSAASSASRDDSASTSNGAAAVLEVIDIGSGTPTVVIEDSANDSTWATLISFTAVADGSEPTAERKTVSGTVDRYLRITTTGTFTDAEIAVGIRRGTSVDDVAYA